MCRRVVAVYAIRLQCSIYIRHLSGREVDRLLSTSASCTPSCYKTWRSSRSPVLPTNTCFYHKPAFSLYEHYTTPLHVTLFVPCFCHKSVPTPQLTGGCILNSKPTTFLCLFALTLQASLLLELFNRMEQRRLVFVTATSITLGRTLFIVAECVLPWISVWSSYFVSTGLRVVNFKML
jgi:hypothetical protein